MTAAATTPRLLTAFGLQEQEAALARAFRITDAAIHGGAALTWLTNTDSPPGQDIDIWCQPSERILSALIYALYDTIFRAAGYSPQPATANTAAAILTEYYGIRHLHIDAIHNWYHPTLERKIQLILRSKTSPTTGITLPASPIAEFDLDITTAKVSASPSHDELVATAPTPTLAAQIARRVMTITNLRGQVLHNNLLRVRKYYSRGYAFETTETTCSCPCGAAKHTAITPPRRLSLLEALNYVRTAWLAANPLSDNHPLRADNLKTRILAENPNLLTITPDRLSELQSYCQATTGFIQNRVTYPAETEWVRNYGSALAGLWSLRSIQSRLMDPVHLKYDQLISSLKRCQVLRSSPILAMYPTLQEELIHLQKNIMSQLENESPPTSPLIKAVTDDDTITHV